MPLNTEVWIRQIKEGFYPDDSFLQKVSDYSEHVNNNTIHFPTAGIDPNVLIDNTTYPISIVQREDDVSSIKLVKFETENTLVRRPEVIEYSYDQLESVIRQHRETLRTKVAQKAAHSYAPQKDGVFTPTVNTTGETYNGRKRVTFDDILSLKERFDVAKIPLEKRYLVLHPSHVTDLLKSDIKLFKNLTDIVNGEPIRFAGFGCFTFPDMPVYDFTTGEKQPFDAAEVGNFTFSSIAYQADEVMKADGEIYMYSRIDDPEERATIVGFDKRFVALPIRGKGVGAIISSLA